MTSDSNFFVSSENYTHNIRNPGIFFQWRLGEEAMKIYVTTSRLSLA